MTKNDKDLRKAVLKLLIALRTVKKDDVKITYPQSKYVKAKYPQNKYIKAKHPQNKYINVKYPQSQISTQNMHIKCSQNKYCIYSNWGTKCQDQILRGASLQKRQRTNLCLVISTHEEDLDCELMSPEEH